MPFGPHDVVVVTDDTRDSHAAYGFIFKTIGNQNKVRNLSPKPGIEQNAEG